MTEGFNDRMSTDDSEVAAWLKSATENKDEDKSPADDDTPPKPSPK